MSETDPEDPAGGPVGAPRTSGRRARRRRPGRPGRPGWRLVTPAVVVVSGLLFSVSATNSEGTDLRPGRYRDMASIVQGEASRYDALAARASALTEEVDALTASVASDEVEQLRDVVASLREPAGLEPEVGAGVSVVLADAPDQVVEDAVAAGVQDINELVVHQQDIQAVVNALWRGGAEAVTVEGQRLVSTTGIKCEGNAVQLQGIPYPQPYEIAAVGDPVDLATALERDPYVAGYRAAAADPSVAVGWQMDLETEVVAPGYDGLLDLSYAEPLD